MSKEIENLFVEDLIDNITSKIPDNNILNNK